MRTDFYCDSLGGGKIHGCRWTPEGEVKAVVQFVHGIAEYVERYDDFANYLNTKGILVVAEDHMGHGKSICDVTPRGCFAGGWQTAVKDTYRLLKNTMEEFSGVPYILFGHSMGSFMARTILARYPDSGIAGAIICGSAWMPGAVIGAGKALATMICKKNGEQNPSDLLQSMMFGGYNKKIEHPRTASDWLSRDNRIVDAYVADPLCGFVPSAGLVRDMMTGLQYMFVDDYHCLSIPAVVNWNTSLDIYLGLGTELTFVFDPYYSDPAYCGATFPFVMQMGMGGRHYDLNCYFKAYFGLEVYTIGMRFAYLF